MGKSSSAGATASNKLNAAHDYTAYELDYPPVQKCRNTIRSGPAERTRERNKPFRIDKDRLRILPDLIYLHLTLPIDETVAEAMPVLMQEELACFHQ
jgi:hypothetical protein